ncbi:MAG: hypothetical protein ABFD97_25080 [Syntrophobacter sp.]
MVKKHGGRRDDILSRVASREEAKEKRRGVFARYATRGMGFDTAMRG